MKLAEAVALVSAEIDFGHWPRGRPQKGRV